MLRRDGQAPSGGHGRQPDERIFPQRRDGFERPVAHRPVIVLLQQDGAGQADDRLLVGEDADEVDG